MRTWQRGVDKARRFVDGSLFAQDIGHIRQRCADHFALAPLLKAAMNRLVVRIALRKHMPLRAGVQDPQHRLEHLARGDRLSTGAVVWITLLRKMHPDQIPLLVGQPQHA